MQKWSQFSKHDLQEFNGSVEELVARIQQKTGASRESIEEFLQTVSQEGASLMNRVKEQVSGSVASAREKVDEVTERTREGYHQMQDRVTDTIHERPGTSLAAAFGIGVVVGVGLSLLLFQSEPEPMSRRYARRAQKLGNRFWDTLAENLPESISQRMS